MTVDHRHAMPADEANSKRRSSIQFKPSSVALALRSSWSLATAIQWTRERPAVGQCNVTALLVHELFGGELLKTSLAEGDHFYNRVNGRRYDFTDSQFDQPITYDDIPTTRADAERGATKAELASLRAAFERHWLNSH
jgi:hypothetical protein